jgi:hypothetical protein
VIVVLFFLLTGVITVGLMNHTGKQERKHLEGKVYLLEAAEQDRDYYKQELGKYEKIGGGPFRSPQPVEKPVEKTAEKKPLKKRKPQIGRWNHSTYNESVGSSNGTMTFTVHTDKVDEEFLQELQRLHNVIEDTSDLSSVRAKMQEAALEMRKAGAEMRENLQNSAREIKRANIEAAIRLRKRLDDD